MDTHRMERSLIKVVLFYIELQKFHKAFSPVSNGYKQQVASENLLGD